MRRCTSVEGAPADLHATAAVVGERGVLVRGPSGSGKTTLVLALVEGARKRSQFARLVADDRVLVERRGGRLVARPHPALAGLVERRGLGIVPAEHEPACVLALVVDLAAEAPDRVPAPEALRCRVAGVALPRLAVLAGAATDASAALVLHALAAVGAAGDDGPISLAKLAAMHKIAPEPNRRAGNPPKA